MTKSCIIIQVGDKFLASVPKNLAPVETAMFHGNNWPLTNSVEQFAQWQDTPENIARLQLLTTVIHEEYPGQTVKLCRMTTKPPVKGH